MNASFVKSAIAAIAIVSSTLTAPSMAAEGSLRNIGDSSPARTVSFVLNGDTRMRVSGNRYSARSGRVRCHGTVRVRETRRGTSYSLARGGCNIRSKAFLGGTLRVRARRDRTRDGMLRNIGGNNDALGRWTPSRDGVAQGFKPETVPVYYR